MQTGKTRKRNKRERTEKANGKRQFEVQHLHKKYWLEQKKKEKRKMEQRKQNKKKSMYNKDNEKTFEHMRNMNKHDPTKKLKTEK